VRAFRESEIQNADGLGKTSGKRSERSAEKRKRFLARCIALLPLSSDVFNLMAISPSAIAISFGEREIGRREGEKKRKRKKIIPADTISHPEIYFPRIFFSFFFFAHIRTAISVGCGVNALKRRVLRGSAHGIVNLIIPTILPIWSNLKRNLH